MPPRAQRRRSRRYKAEPPQGINFACLVHRIHDGVNAAADDPKNPYIVVGHGGKP